MKITGIDGMAYEDVKAEVDRGGVFVIYQYCISLLVITFKQPSEAYFIRRGHSRIIPGLPLTFVALLLGWWGIPWGPVRTIQSLITNFRGGLDVTGDVMASIRPPRQNVNPPLPPKR